MASPFAVVTLVSSDSYLPGALAQVAALRDLHPSPAELPEVDFQTVCIVTPESLDVATIKRLRKAFDLVVGVEILEQENAQGLKLLGKSFIRPNAFNSSVWLHPPAYMRLFLHDTNIGRVPQGFSRYLA